MCSIQCGNKLVVSQRQAQIADELPGSAADDCMPLECFSSAGYALRIVAVIERGMVFIYLW